MAKMGLGRNHLQAAPRREPILKDEADMHKFKSECGHHVMMHAWMEQSLSED